MSADTIFSPEKIRAIQTDELSEIASLSLEQIAQRIQHYQETSRELYLRMGKASEELSRRLREKNSEELEGLIEKVPAAERELVSRRGFPKPKPLTAKEKTIAKAKAMAKSDPLMDALIKELGLKK